MSKRKNRDYSSSSSKLEKYRKESSLSISALQHSLPVYKYKYKLLESIKKNQVIIVTGETGCGKSTQIPQYLYLNNILKNKLVCTQPRRVGAISLAQRVSHELKSVIGNLVGYSIRFENNTCDDTKIIYMTDGVLIRELQDDPHISKFSIVMLDEAHERTIQTDALFGILKKLLKQRKDLKLIISSATLNATKFSKYFNDAPIFKIPGRLHDVKIKYNSETEKDYLKAVCDRILRIHSKRKLDGDILAFLPGQDDIDKCCSILSDKTHSTNKKNDLIVLPAYSALPQQEISKIFNPTPSNSRKVIVATNIAETSLTIEGIKYVIDCGLVKQNSYNTLMGINQLIEVDISRAQADQRAGRAGRMTKGYCYRLYTEKRLLKKFQEETLPEIKRVNLSNTVLQLMSIGIKNVIEFDFIDHPGSERIKEALSELKDIGALNKDETLSKLGELMAQFPLDPMLSKVLIMSCHKQCSEELLTIVSMLCVQNIFDKLRDDGIQKRKSLYKHHGDHITYLNIYLKWRDSGYSKEWCYEHQIRYLALVQVQNIRNQLLDIMKKINLELISCGSKISLVQDTISFYYFRRSSAKKCMGDSGYRTIADDQLVHIHPGSVLFSDQPNWVVFHDVVVTKDKFMRIVTKISAQFLKEHVPHEML